MTTPLSAMATGGGEQSSSPGADQRAASLAYSATEHLCRAQAFGREPILASEAQVERKAAADQLREALTLLEAA
ncbi:MAG: hypothetical protein ACT6TH_15090 [Brevundimonas sp.]|uniref:hypothetical protein n=1 Tax=Brevundimonas sp. TaxID=1871086 RepID=UPI0040344B37